MSVAENLMLKSVGSRRFSCRWGLKRQALLSHAEGLMSSYDVRAPGPNVKIQLLSGGNQQKVVLARELSSDPRVLVAVHPTRGLDISATDFVHEMLLRIRERGCAVLLISSELDEVLRLANRVAVMYEGRIVGLVESRGANLEQIGLMMAGLEGATRETRR